MSTKQQRKVKKKVSFENFPKIGGVLKQKQKRGGRGKRESKKKV